MACPVKPDNDTGKVNLGREFPENRENNREFCRFAAFWAVADVNFRSNSNVLRANSMLVRNREFIRRNREMSPPVVRGTKVVAVDSSLPGLSRRSRSGGRSAQVIEMAGTSPAMTK